jgi:hypothetical protein
VTSYGGISFAPLEISPDIGSQTRKLLLISATGCDQTKDGVQLDGVSRDKFSAYKDFTPPLFADACP